ncbi:MAG: signal peptidase II [Myxococcota bacterium]
MNRRNITFALCAVLGLIADQGSKWWIINNIALNTGEIPLIDGLLSLVYVQNPGALFGLGAGSAYAQPVFLVFTVVALFVIGDMFRRLPPTDTYMAAALGLVLSGAIGNGLDRLRFAKVTDFIRFYTEDPGLVAWLRGLGLPPEYPSFNIADAALVVGIGMFIIHYLFLEKRESASTEATEAPAPSEEPASE